LRILLVAPLFPPDMGVSALRMKFLRDGLSSEQDVDVLKLGDKTDFSGSLKLIDRRLFAPFLIAVINRRKIGRLVCALLLNYDLIIVSATPYGLYEIAHAAKRVGVPYILDLRDLPNLTTAEQKNTKPLLWLHIKSWLIELYIQTAARYAEALLCVGTISTALMQQKLKYSPCRIINLHNGFEEKDIELVQKCSRTVSINQDQLIVGCVGNIFRFRDTQSLRDTLMQLNSRKGQVILKHWGKLGPDLEAHIRGLRNINYVACSPIPRDDLLAELHAVNCFLLPCSSDLIWEPTTSVFDYILFNKPVIFAGLHNNEAYLILQSTNTLILESGDLTHFDFKSFAYSEKNRELLRCYSREFYLDRLLIIIRKLESRTPACD
jgi:hypothetical protein